LRRRARRQRRGHRGHAENPPHRNLLTSFSNHGCRFPPAVKHSRLTAPLDLAHSGRAGEEKDGGHHGRRRRHPASKRLILTIPHSGEQHYAGPTIELAHGDGPANSDCIIGGYVYSRLGT
jgi:hypothetical protein